ncbi:conserved hypothetical protein, membrane [Candidatus Thiomargarita nelsonii]|uniref:Uncharacterized protein n=1 Tax=Candidatus Thiomargarita nelsonii TaxID=1003181 RepID=A0A0A6P1L2_9GAMM|nr:conserved hypothetical protein, membrane [Candidatus Thiomargarita nelsonii]
MLIIWRGLGWLIPVVVFAAFILTQIGVDTVFGVEDYYKTNEWPKYFAIGIASLATALLGFVLNYKKRKIIHDERTGEPIGKSPSHALFFIPVEYWAILIPAIFILSFNYSAEQDKQDLAYLEAPAVNDQYLVDFTKIYEGADKKYKYGVIKVTAITEDGVDVILSDVAYDKISGPRKDIRNNKTNDSKYYSSQMTHFKKSELIEMKKREAIYSVYRD